MAARGVRAVRRRRVALKRWLGVPELGEKHEGTREFEFDAGTHAIEVGYRENRVRLDALLVTADGVPPIGRGLVPPSDVG